MNPVPSWTLLSHLAGRWSGTGSGYFPTISTFEYRETLEFTIDSEGRLDYSQRTWRVTDDGEVASHRETGFLGIDAHGRVQMSGSHGLDRVEVLVGSLIPDDDGFSVDLESAVLGHDDRMISSWRRLTLAGDVLSYEMGMTTTAVPEGGQHLRAVLHRTAVS